MIIPVAVLPTNNNGNHSAIERYRWSVINLMGYCEGSEILEFNQELMFIINGMEVRLDEIETIPTLDVRLVWRNVLTNELIKGLVL